MLGLLVNDVRNHLSAARPETRLQNPMQLFTATSFHGGVKAWLKHRETLLRALFCSQRCLARGLQVWHHRPMFRHRLHRGIHAGALLAGDLFCAANVGLVLGAAAAY